MVRSPRLHVGGAIPAVERTLNPSPTSRRTTPTIGSLSESFTDTKALIPGPPLGRVLPAAAWAFKKAEAKSWEMPIDLSRWTPLRAPAWCPPRGSRRPRLLDPEVAGAKPPTSSSDLPTMQRAPALAFLKAQAAAGNTLPKGGPGCWAFVSVKDSDKEPLVGGGAAAGWARVERFHRGDGRLHGGAGHPGPRCARCSRASCRS